VIAEEQERLREYQLKFERDRPDFEGKEILIVDDGLATGATMEAAVLSGKKRMARKVLVAVPVASDNAFDRIQRVSDGAHALLVDPEFEAVGGYYHRFSQTTDEEVLDLLSVNRGGRS